MAFNAVLPRTVNLPHWESKPSSGEGKSEKAAELQSLFDKSTLHEYESVLSLYKTLIA